MRRAEEMREPFYSLYGGRFEGDEPCFYDPEEFPWVRLLEENWQVIRDEARTLLARHENRLRPYFNRAMAFPPGRWKTLGFYYWGIRLHRNCADCPRTARLLESIPNMTAGSLSILEPRTNINPHQGDTNAVVRVHLGLCVPAPLPRCGLQVGEDVRGWEEGRALLFCDAHRHLSWNDSDERRLVLIVDVMRPEFADASGAVCAHVLAKLLGQALAQRFAQLERVPPKIRYAAHFLARGVFRLLVPAQRRARFFSKFVSR